MNSEQKQQEYDDLITLKQVIEPELDRLGELILLHKAQDNDQDFADYIDKAAYHWDVLKRINADLIRLAQ